MTFYLVSSGYCNKILPSRRHKQKRKESRSWEKNERKLVLTVTQNEFWTRDCWTLNILGIFRLCPCPQRYHFGFETLQTSNYVVQTNSPEMYVLHMYCRFLWNSNTVFVFLSVVKFTGRSSDQTFAGRHHLNLIYMMNRKFKAPI